MAHKKADSLSTLGAPVNEEVQRREWEDSMEDQRLEEALFVNEVGTARGGGARVRRERRDMEGKRLVRRRTMMLLFPLNLRRGRRWSS